MKSLNKKLIIIPIILLTAIITIVALVMFFNKKPNDEKHINEYEAYININPLVKLIINEECLNNKCSIPYVSNYELINDDAKNFYKDLDFIIGKLNII